MRRKDAWTRDPRGEDFALAKDPDPVMWRVLLTTQRWDAARLERARRAWLDDWRQRGSAVLVRQPAFLWMRGYAEVAEGAEQAQAALVALPSFGTIPPFRPLTLASARIGRLYFEAGDDTNAEHWLQIASRHCASLLYPMYSTQAHDDLGRLRERQGNSQAACDAYAMVLHRWGTATPSSRTAAHARARSRVLGCDRRPRSR